MTSDERNKDEIIGRMNQCDKPQGLFFEAQSADVSQGLRDVDSSKVMDPDNED
jgi:hypothetical protein